MKHKKLLLFFSLLLLLAVVVLAVRAQFEQTQDVPAHVQLGDAADNATALSYPMKVTWRDGSPVRLIDFGKRGVNSVGQPCSTCPYVLKIENGGIDVIWVTASLANLTSGFALEAYAYDPPAGQIATDLAQNSMMLKPSESVPVTLTLLWANYYANPPKGDFDFSVQFTMR
jgi:hypothetical protein